MKIKILKDTSVNQVYGHLIGKVFDVIDTEVDHKKYMIRHIWWMYHINFSDCEILSEAIVKRANDWESLRNKGLDTKLTMDKYNKSDDHNHE
jgi:hypothetical protein